MLLTFNITHLVSIKGNVIYNQSVFVRVRHYCNLITDQSIAIFYSCILIFLIKFKWIRTYLVFILRSYRIQNLNKK